MMMGKNIRTSASVRLVDMKVGTGEAIHVAGARIGEKAVHLKVNLSLSLHCIIHHTHDPESDDSLETTAEAMTAATERRLRREQEAHERAEWERGLVQERSASKMSKHMEDHHSQKLGSMQELLRA